MPDIFYKVIKSEKQYAEYKRRLESLRSLAGKTTDQRDEEELLDLLVRTFEREQDSYLEADPVQLLKGLMKEQGVKAVQLARMLQISEGLVSDMLHYKKAFSKKTIRLLSQRFQMSQEAFNRPYSLKGIKHRPGKRPPTGNPVAG